MMKTILVLIFFNAFLIHNSFGQTGEQVKKDDNTVKVVSCGIPLNTTYVIKVKKHQLILDNNTSEKSTHIENLNPEWIKSVSVLGSSDALKLGFNENPLVIIELKDKNWKNLPKDLRRALKR